MNKEIVYCNLMTVHMLIVTFACYFNGGFMCYWVRWSSKPIWNDKCSELTLFGMWYWSRMNKINFGSSLIELGVILRKMWVFLGVYLLDFPCNNPVAVFGMATWAIIKKKEYIHWRGLWILFLVLFFLWLNLVRNWRQYGNFSKTIWNPLC